MSFFCISYSEEYEIGTPQTEPKQTHPFLQNILARQQNQQNVLNSSGGDPRNQNSSFDRRKRTFSFTKSGSKADPVLRTPNRTIYTAGRPPWYNTQGQSKECLIIGVCGGSASGKTTVARKIIEALDVPWVTLLCMDSFYKVLNDEEHESADKNEYNFDHPDAFDYQLLIETVRKLKDGKRVEVPVYNFVTHGREKYTVTF